MVAEKTIIQVLEEQREEVEGYRFKKWVSRKEEAFFEFGSNLAQVVIGVRRSGKSTLCHKVLREAGVRYAYANLDDDRLADMETVDLNVLLSCIYQLYGTDVQYIFLDEIQDVRGWHLFVNRLLRIGIHVFVTGSNAKLLSSELATHLTGRYNEIRLFPFSFSEYCNYYQIDAASVTTKADAERKRAFHEYCNVGGFPELLSIRNKRNYVQGLIEAILLKDVTRRFGVRHPEVLRRIAHHLIGNACQIVNYEEMSKLLGVSDKTVKKYVDYLRQAFLVQLVPKHSYKSKERIYGEKLYLVDVGLENNREISMAAENLGWRLENIVYTELMRRCAREYLDVYYYKPTPRAREVDFVVCNQSRAQELIQVSYDIGNPKVLARETVALVQASAVLRCDNLTLIAFSPPQLMAVEGKEIKICNALDWLLGDSTHRNK